MIQKLLDGDNGPSSTIGHHERSTGIVYNSWSTALYPSLPKVLCLYDCEDNEQIYIKKNQSHVVAKL